MADQRYILGLGVKTPEFSQQQNAVADKVVNALPDDDPHAAVIRRIYRGSKIEKRHSVVADYANESLAGEFFGDDFPRTAPGMSRRNELYREAAPRLACEAAEQAILDWGGSPDRITHVVSVSCTGLIAPGIEFLLIDALGLKRSTERLGINFMGCFGAFKGLAVARALALEDPGHRVLVVCTELCSLHFHLNGRLDTHVANALFADGAAAVVVGCGPRHDESACLEILRSQSFAMESSRELMTWEAADEGLVMTISSEVPSALDSHVPRFSRELLGAGLSFEDCDWALHPGGKAILEAIEKSCRLLPDQVAASWEVMSAFGNMSSATFLFVLDRLRRVASKRSHIIGLGFGPGLSMEGLLLRRVGG